MRERRGSRRGRKQREQERKTEVWADDESEMGPSSHARLGCYDNIICGQAELLKSEGLRCALGWPWTHCLCMIMCGEEQKREKCAPSWSPLLNRVAMSFPKERYGPSNNMAFAVKLNNSWYDHAVKLWSVLSTLLKKLLLEFKGVIFGI